MMKVITVDLPTHPRDPAPLTRISMSPRSARGLVRAYDRRARTKGLALIPPPDAWHFVAINPAGFVFMSVVGGVDGEIGRFDMCMDPIKADAVIEGVRLELAEFGPGIITKLGRLIGRNRRASAPTDKERSA